MTDDKIGVMRTSRLGSSAVEVTQLGFGGDRIDVLVLHESEDHFETAMRDGYPAPAELRAEGLVDGCAPVD